MQILCELNFACPEVGFIDSKFNEIDVLFTLHLPTHVFPSMESYSFLFEKLNARTVAFMRGIRNFSQQIVSHVFMNVHFVIKNDINIMISYN